MSDWEFMRAGFMVMLSNPTIILGSIIGGFAARRFVHVILAALIVGLLHQIFVTSYENVAEFSLVSLSLAIPAAFVLVTVAFIIRLALERVTRIND